jgi:Tfp pilus assembly protein PilW
MALLEWMVANSLGLLVTAAAMAVFLHQARVVLSLHQRQLQQQDLRAVAQTLRSELRMAGHRLRPGPHAAYDRLGLAGSPNPTLSYLCDACGASDPSRPAGFRLQSGTLAHRAQSAGSFQAVHEATTSAWRAWEVLPAQVEPCVQQVELRLLPAGPALAPVHLKVRPRNLGPLACEATARPATGPA